MKADAVAVRQPRAIVYGAFRLTADGLVVHGKGEFGDWSDAVAATEYLETKSPWWLADLLEYAHKRPDWEGLIDSVIDAGTFTKRTVEQKRWVSRNVPAEDRVEGLSFAHHEAVAALPSGDKKIFLKKAKTEHLSVAELKATVRKVKHRKILRGQASELAVLQTKVADLAWDAVDACKAIAREDAKHAEKSIKLARRLLDECESAVTKLRKAQGKKA